VQIEHITKQLEQTYNGQPWYGDSVAMKINAISAETAFLQTSPGLHSIAEILAHMIVWRKAAIEWLRGNSQYNVTLNSKDDWPLYETLQEIGWEELKQQFADTQTQLLSLLRNRTDEILPHPYSKKPYTFQFLLEGIIQHDVYHLGQIGVIVKAASLKQ
jgi:uncharacterized damage-inducible protein DinB